MNLHIRKVVGQAIGARNPLAQRAESVLRSIGRMIDDAGEAEAAGEPDTLKRFRLATLVMAIWDEPGATASNSSAASSPDPDAPV